MAVTILVAAKDWDLASAPTTNSALVAWVRQVAHLTQPGRIVWCDGSQAEWDRLTREMVAAGTLTALNPDKRPGSFLARSAPSDVARVETRTFIASRREEDAGPTNQWREPVALREELEEAFQDSMRGRVMYVVPFAMGPLDGPFVQYGVELTDSPYVVASMRIMTRMGSEILARITEDTPFVPAVHSVGYPLIDRNDRLRADVPWPCNSLKYIAHFPETREIWSYGSGYGGNALLGKKCMALRIASVVARDEGWLAEHMLLVRVTSPAGQRYHVAAAFPSACGKTNFAMLQPSLAGWQVETIGDDIAWMRRGPDDRLRAVNPEAGFFGVAPGTGPATNANALATIASNTIFTNVALTDDGDVWWEGLTATPPAQLTDWQGRRWTPDCIEPAAHPNARFTVAVDQCPSIAEDWDDPAGVPIDAIIFGGRRASNVPLVTEARDWDHGVFLGATIASEQTAAAEGPVGKLRRDPFAMLPFAGYNMADYWSHWLEVGHALPVWARPVIFQVNWFRRSEDGRFLWPGFGENSRVLKWICERLDGTAEAVLTPLGAVPAPGALDLTGLDVAAGDLDELLSVDHQAWLAECDSTETWLQEFGSHVPDAVVDQLSQLRGRLGAEGASGRREGQHPAR
ncbi:phosphoenolpyruvate carboxykinase (GTP) [Acidothermaceae bacterium B102]|nr:phosphoenolpyruvate carboxykinase (GTP) [Acidothermaceae bacterium B102]